MSQPVLCHRGLVSSCIYVPWKKKMHAAAEVCHSHSELI